MSDTMDDLLNRSAPVLADRGTARDAGLAQMVADARDTVRRPKLPRRRIAAASAVIGALLLGGAGVAAANSDWLWGPGLENPDRSYAYTSPTWGRCEIRFSGLDTHDPLIQADVNRIIDEWFAEADVEAAAALYLPEYLAFMKDSAENAAVDGDEGSGVLSPDHQAWTAHEQALGAAMYDELKEHGYDPGHGLAGAEAHSQLHCEGEEWGGKGGEQ